MAFWNCNEKEWLPVASLEIILNSEYVLKSAFAE